MDSTTTRYLADLLPDHGDQIVVKRWTASVASTLHGRLGEAELGRQIHELYGALRGAVDASAELTVDSAESSELRTVLNELSRQRAHHGFSSTETAVSVSALKEPVLEVTDSTDPAALRNFVEVSHFVDELGLYTFESYAKTREELIADQAAVGWSRRARSGSPPR